MPDRETIITTTESDSGTGMGTGVLAGIVIALILLVAGGYIVFSHNASSGTVSIDVPKVTVTPPAN